MTCSARPSTSNPMVHGVAFAMPPCIATSERRYSSTVPKLPAQKNSQPKQTTWNTANTASTRAGPRVASSQIA